MTKILYIPTGQYLQFLKGGNTTFMRDSGLRTIELEESVWNEVEPEQVILSMNMLSCLDILLQENKIITPCSIQEFIIV